MDNKSKSGRPRAPWRDSEIAILRQYYPIEKTEDVAVRLGKSARAIRSAAIVYNAEKSGRYWDADMEKYLVDNYTLLSIEELQAHLVGKTKWAIINKYRSLAGLRVDNGGAKHI